MRNLCLIIVSLFLSINIYSQNIAYKIGASGIVSLSNSKHGLLPGAGIALDNRIEFRGSQFEIKNYLAIETTPKINSTFTNQNLIKLGVSGEYNFFRFGYINRFGRNWTPYAGIGINAIYYRTGISSDNSTESNKDDVTNYIEGVTFSLRTSIGFKYKLDKRFILTVETAMDWGGEDSNKGRSFVSAGDNYSSITSIGVTYSLNY